MKVVTTLGALLAACCWLALPAAAAASPEAGPAWTVRSISQPTNFAAGSTKSSDQDQYQIMVTNTGGAPADGSPIVVSDELPAGVTLAGGASGSDAASNQQSKPSNSVSCVQGSSDPQNVTCTDADTAPLAPDAQLTITIPVNVSSAASGTVINSVSVSGGADSTPVVSTSEATAIGSSPAPFGLQSASVRALNADGSPDTQAGSHPYQVVTALALTTHLDADGGVLPSGNIDTTTLNLPVGLVGAATATPTCSQQLLAAEDSGQGGCPTDAQIGVAYISAAVELPNTVQEVPVYNMTPPAGEPAQFGFQFAGHNEDINWSVRAGGDYGLTATLSPTDEEEPIYGATVDLWGDPADSSHDTQRYTAQATFNNQAPGDADGSPLPDGAPALPLIDLPTSCGSTLPVQISVTSWQSPNQPVSSGTLSATGGQPLTGCGDLPFSPSLSVQPTTSTADAPSGLDVDLSVPQVQNVDGLTEANLRNATVTLPAGTTVDPSAASGLTGCSPNDIGINNANAPTCPDNSKVGTVEIDTPLLPDPLEGSIYVAQPNNNPFNSLLAIYVTAFGDGVWVKLAGHVQANPVTGQLQTTFSNNPQLPFSDLKLDFFSGSQGILATPQGCGTFTTTSDLSSWAGGPDASPSDPFAISSGCVNGFSPSFTAGTQNPQAGAYSPFVLSFSRADTDQNLSGLSVTLPEGMLAKLAGVSECSDTQLAAAAASTGTAELASPSCPASSQVGTVTAGSGVGPSPFFLSGNAYLTGPYKGAPYGIAVVVPAVAGPYDLGTVVVRQALFIDPETAQVTDVSDQFPTILDGIPLDIQRIDVDLNRPDFTVNPTSCNPMAVTGTLTSTDGLTDNVSSRFQVGGCQDIGFSPKLKIALTGKGKTRSGDHPMLAATLTDPAGQANIRSAKVALPLSLALDPDNSDNVCAFATAAAVHGGTVGCATKTIVGSATAVTPLLSESLTGPVYLVQGLRCKTGQVSAQGTCASGAAIRTLPSLLVPLRGQIALDLRAQTSVSGGRLVTTFPTIPDAAVSKFTLKINGGKKGLLVVTGRGQSICQKNQVGNADLGAQSGVATTKNMTLTTPCGKPAKLSVLSHRVRAGKLVLKVHTSEKGEVTVTGNGLKAFGQTMAAGTHQISVEAKPASAEKPTTKAKSKRRAEKTTPSARNVKVAVRVTPANAKAATKAITARI